MQMLFFLPDDNKKTVNPVVNLDDNSEPEDFLDYVPPSPLPDDISRSKSSCETR